MSKSIIRRLLASVTATMFTAGLTTASWTGAAAAGVDITPDSQTLVYLMSGFGSGSVLCANPDDNNVWIGNVEDKNAFCQWEQIGNDKQFTLFNPARGMVLTGVRSGQLLAMNELLFPSAKSQTFAWASGVGGLALQWHGDLAQVVDAGSEATPSSNPLRLGAWRPEPQQTWSVKQVGADAVPQKARSASTVRVTSGQWPDHFLCADLAEGNVKLSTDKNERRCEWLPFGSQTGPFVLYNPEFGKVLSYSGGSNNPLALADLKYPNSAQELWAFGPKSAPDTYPLQWVGDTSQNVDAGTGRPTINAVRTRTWDPRAPKPLTWKFDSTVKERRTATVTMGDSFMSGEGGRWKGNSDSLLASRDGTDRAYTGWERYDPQMIYGYSYYNGCNRSDSAESHSSNANDVQINIACSGAETTDVWRDSFKGEAPQTVQLSKVARQYDVRLIALSIGGNDLGFSGIIKACVMAYTKGNAPCKDEQQKIIISKLAETRKNVVKTINEIQATMTAAGYALDQYQFVIQSAPSPTPMASEMRYPESGWDRVRFGGCPFKNVDADWARGQLTAEISNMIRSAAQEAKVGFLDLQNALNGREVCAKSSTLVNGDNPPSGTSSEWARFLVTGWGQGELQESFHPNYYGQRALGRCLALYNDLPYNQAACTNTPGAEPERMVLTEIG